MTRMEKSTDNAKLRMRHTTDNVGNHKLDEL
jgi:hypothetical protein